LLLVLGSLGVCRGSGNDNAQNPAPQHALYLNRANTGQHVAATVGQPIHITLQTIGPGQYNSPEISSSAIRFESVAFADKQNPGGPTQVYHFLAASEGEAQIKIPHTESNPVFVVTIRVYKRRKP
jgi:hypothetical protein